MSPKQCVSWLTLLAIASALLLLDADAARADGWSVSSDCGCDDQLFAAGFGVPRASAGTTGSFRMRPTPSYNSTWARVPVTNYRPQVVADPFSGVRYTALQPCNSFEWQARRTPGCSLWQRLVNWWRSHCRCGGRPSMSPCAMPCDSTSGLVVSSTEPAASPYYTPSTGGASSTNGRLVPVPSSASPSSPVPADRRPQLDPIPRRSGGEGSAARLLPPNTEVLMSAIDDVATSLEFGPPLVAPGSRSLETATLGDLPYASTFPEAEVDTQPAVPDATFSALTPVSWSLQSAPPERKLPTDEVWDDTGWRSEQ